jgi:catechol 2,3-dioxygenase-like lactoylglutathione lyase family enzyme
MVRMKFELVPVPVADVDRARDFYVEAVGFVEDLDVRPTEGMRLVQLTPPGSGCSILLSTGVQDVEEMTPGTLRQLHLVVDDLVEAREELASRGVAVSDINEVGRGVSYVYFADPDGNTWALQQMDWRTGAAF